MKSSFSRIVFLFLLLCQLAPAQQRVRTIFLVRHAEKTSESGDPGLSPEGQKRAACLAQMLKDASIKHIYVTDARRTQQTAEPLAKAEKVEPTVIAAKDPNSLIRNLTYGTGNVLVIGHSNTLPFVIARMNAGTIPEIGENEYDRMFVITATEGVSAPATTLHYCSAATPAAPAKHAPAKKTGTTKKAPAKK